MVFVCAISAEDQRLTWSMTFRESGYCTFTATIVPLYFNFALCTCREHTVCWILNTYSYRLPMLDW